MRFEEAQFVAYDGSNGDVTRYEILSHLECEVQIKHIVQSI